MTQPGKKRVIFFIPSFPVVSETFIEREIAELYHRNNIDVTVLSLKNNTAPPFNFSELKAITHYIDLSVIDILVGFLNFLFSRPGLFSALNVVINNPNRSASGNLYLWLKSLGYAHIFKKYKPDLIFAHFLSEPSTIVYIVSTLLNVPFIVSGHAKDVYGKSTLVSENAELLPQKAAAAKYITLCNKKAYDHVKSLVQAPVKLKVILNYHGLDVEKLQNTGAELIDPPVFFYAGRFVEKKGLSYLLKAVKILTEKNLKFKLVLAGYGPLFDQLNEEIQNLGITNYVEFLNPNKGTPNDEILQYLSKVFAFVMPSINMLDGDSDGIPNNVLEAGAAGKPVITTDAGSITEIVEHNKTGLVVPQRDSKALADAMVSLLSNRQLAENLSSNLHQKVLSNFDIKKNILSLEKMITE